MCTQCACDSCLRLCCTACLLRCTVLRCALVLLVVCLVGCATKCHSLPAYMHFIRLSGGSHIELPCNEVSGEEGARVSTAMAAAAREWFSSLAAGPHAFAKPTFWLGLGGWRVTNLLPDGAHARTPQRVVLLSNGATGFNKPGDFLCFDVQARHTACAFAAVVGCLLLYDMVWCQMIQNLQAA
jgi:hypothetical protein